MPSPNERILWPVRDNVHFHILSNCLVLTVKYDSIYEVRLFQRSSSPSADYRTSELCRYIAEYCLLCCLYCLSGLLALSESLSTKLFDYVSRTFNTRPCGVFPAQESAIVIVGGDDGKSP